MAEELKDPEIINGVAVYTLSSFDSISVEVKVANVNDDDIDEALMGLVSQEGGGLQQLFDNEWIAQKFSDCKNYNDLRSKVVNQLDEVRSNYMSQKRITCILDVLCSRLEQRVPNSEIALTNVRIQQSVESSIYSQGLTVPRFMEMSGISQNEMEKWYEEQAIVVARQQAALSAYARYYNVQVSNSEMFEFVNLPKADAMNMLQEATKRGQLEVIRQSAVNTKALHMLLDESSCEYVYTDDMPFADMLDRFPQINLL